MSRKAQSRTPSIDEVALLDQFLQDAALARTGPTPLGALADLMGLERTSRTRSANRLQDEGWVAQAESADARVRKLKLTPAGRRKVESAYSAWKEAQDEVDQQLEMERDHERRPTMPTLDRRAEPGTRTNDAEPSIHREE